ncbi:hypothetical protein JOQ06_029844 [Pogonophryne albipinna]|uniref:Uncharacterized protein n=1 Tax=Pogonophryne albipinna TaxID=1090488 RepID=A0AAD6AXT7_9TELE|nr:hypothetical protein JOQ06_029844 [Pogonophryne albipinna]
MDTKSSDKSCENGPASVSRSDLDGQGHYNDTEASPGSRQSQGTCPPYSAGRSSATFPPLMGAGDGIVKQCICETQSPLMEA